MKFFKLNINDNGHRIGFVFNNIDMLQARLNRALERANQLNKQQMQLTEIDSETEYLMELTVR